MDFLQQNRTILIIESILLIILGAIAIALPFYATISVTLIVAWVLLLSGLVQLIKSIMSFKESGGAISLIGAIIYTVVGALMVIYPMTGILTLTILLGVFFLVEGFAKIAFSFELRPARNWGWLLFSGIIALIMGGIILGGWPQTSLWVLGLLVGINLIFFGFALLALVSNVPKKSY